MQTTIQIKLLPNKFQAELLVQTMHEYIAAVNNIVAQCITEGKALYLSSKDIHAYLQSSVKAEVSKTAKSMYKTHCKRVKEAEFYNKRHTQKPKRIPEVPIAKKPIASWNNQNFKICDGEIQFPVLIDGKSKRIAVKAIIPEDKLEQLSNSKLGNLRIIQKNGKFIAQIAIEQEELTLSGNKVMGIDLGIKCPAVCCTDEGEVKFVGNGRKNKYIRRKFKSKRRRLQKKKKLNAIKRINNKEQRVMRDINHKLSREIVNFAIKHNVAVIRLEELANIRKETSKSRKNNYSISTWSFYQLAQFIEYKAAHVGIRVEYVNPAYTSQRCPHCGMLNHAKDRGYECSCGYKGHRDLIGAKNICFQVPVSHGKSVAA